MESLRRILRDRFVTSYLIYFTGSMLVAFCNYLFYPILGRVLGVSSFGEVQALVSLVAQAGIVLAAFSTVTINIVASPGTVHDKAAVIGHLRRIVRWGALVCAVAIALLSTQLELFFRFTSPLPFIGLSIALMALTLPLFYTAYLQGMRQFAHVSATSLIVSVGRIVVAVVLIMLGWGVLGAMGGMIVAQVLAWGYAWRLTRHAPELAGASGDIASAESNRVTRELRYALLVFLTNGSLAVLCTGDILTMKHYFPPAVAGVYAGISAVANIIYFAISPVSGVLLPSVAANPEKRHRTLAMGLGVFAVLGSAILLIFSLFHDIIIAVLMGSKFTGLSWLLPLGATYMLAAALANLLASYFLALRRAAVAVILPAGLLLTGFLSYWHHGTVATVVGNFVIGASATAVCLLILYVQDYFNYRPRLQ